MKAPTMGEHIDEQQKFEESAAPQQRLVDLLPNFGKPWYKVHHLIKLNACLLIPLISSYISGYDGSMLNGMQSVILWKDYFGNPTGSTLGVLSTMQTIGAVVGLPLAPWFTDRFGRRHPIFFGSLFMIFGAAIQTAAHNMGMFLAGRALVGFGGTFAATASAPLIAELAFPSQRPIITAIYNTSWYIGSIVAAWVTYGTFKMSTNWSWRIPSLLQAVPSILQVIFVYLIPESPRWLTAHDRLQDAERVLAKYHVGLDEADDFVRHELAEIQTAIQEEKLQNTSSYLDFFKKGGNRHRLLICISLGFIIQWCGNGLVSYYLVQVLNNIGITSAKTQNIINGVLQVFNYFVAIGAAFTVDRFGRRALFLFSITGMGVAFIIWTAISARNEQQNYESKGLGIAIVLMIFVFFFFYNVGMNPVPVAYLLEVLPFTLRAKGLTIFNTAQFASSIFNGFVNPVALEAIGWKYYIVFLCLIFVWFALIYFLYPETRGLSLEEVSVVFDGKELLPNTGRHVEEKNPISV